MSTDDLIEQAGRNLRRAAASARLLEFVAAFVLVVTVVASLGLFAAGAAGEVGFWPMLGLDAAMITWYAVLRGLASIVSLMVDRVLVEADADDE